MTDQDPLVVPGPPWMPVDRRTTHHESVRMWQHPTGAMVMHADDGWFFDSTGTRRVLCANDSATYTCVMALGPPE